MFLSAPGYNAAVESLYVMLFPRAIHSKMSSTLRRARACPSAIVRDNILKVLGEQEDRESEAVGHADDNSPCFLTDNVQRNVKDRHSLLERLYNMYMDVAGAEHDIYRFCAVALDRDRKRAAIASAPIRLCSTTGKYETKTSEFKDVLVDFPDEEKRGHYKRCHLPSGGEGLAHTKFLLLKQYLHMHPDPLENLEILQVWHPEWTDLMPIFDVHSGADGLLAAQLPSALGHSTAKVNRKAPCTASRVDYYAGMGILRLVSNERMLDCWRIAMGVEDIWKHVEDLEKSQQLISFRQTYDIARTLHRRNSSHRAFQRATLYSLMPP